MGAFSEGKWSRPKSMTRTGTLRRTTLDNNSTESLVHGPNPRALTNVGGKWSRPYLITNVGYIRIDLLIIILEISALLVVKYSEEALYVDDDRHVRK
jgi:hypothetical protein